MTKISLDILAFAAHPDDVEISCGGTLLKAIDSGKRVGIIDFTSGEMGSRGSGTLRLEEANRASELMGLTIRYNLGLRDCFFEPSESTLLSLVTQLRRFRPQIVLCNSPTDRHPDHGRASKMVRDACFYSGLGKIETHFEGQVQDSWRPKAVYQFIQDYFLEPDVVVDISGYWDRKIEVLKCFSSQFHRPDSTEIQTPISGEEFFDFLYGKSLILGRQAGMTLGEGFISDRYIGVSTLDQLI
jgi:bacillithiol biosynthesis deacetylase BshB1